MRRIQRLPLPSASISYLSKRQTKLDSASQPDAEAAWDSARKTQKVDAVHTVLRKMAGPTERCMYCGDSLGDTIEHFYPKASYRSKTFDWNNMLLICGLCNYRKGNQFPLDASGQPLYIDPTIDRPWDHLIFDESTGRLSARFSSGVEDPKGQVVADDKRLPLNRDAITIRRQRVWRDLVRDGQLLLADLRSSGNYAVHLANFVTKLNADDGFGLGTWFVHREGRTLDPFASLQSQFTQIWQQIESAVGP